MSNTLVEMKNIFIEKNNKVILDNVSISLKKNEIHSVIGENGSGKSCLMKVLAGNERTFNGEIFLDSIKIKNSNVSEIQKMGIFMIYHDINLIPSLNAVENIFINNWIYYKGKMPIISWKKQKQAVKKMFEILNVDINLEIPVSSLGNAEQRMVEIVKAIYKKAKVLILDETTSALSDKETKDLFKVLKNAKNLGTSIFFISHKVKEIEDISDKVTILKSGKIVNTKYINEISVDQAFDDMIDKKIKRYPKINFNLGKCILEIEDLTDKIFLDKVSFSLKKGEILGVTGQMGSGRTVLANALTGMSKIVGGNIYINSEKITIKSPRDAIVHKIAYIPEDYSNGLIYSMDIPKNISLSNLKSVVTKNVIDLDLEKKLAKEYVQRLGLKSKFVNKIVKYLSNGDKQKVMIAKCMLSRSKIFVLDEPTKGLDAASKVEVYNIMNKIIMNGGAIILISSDFSELIGMCNRLLIMRKGKIVEELNDNDITEKNIVSFSKI